MKTSSPRTAARSPFLIVCAWNSSSACPARLFVLPTRQPRTRNRVPPVRHAPAGIGRTRGATSAAPIHVVLHWPDDLLRGDVFLAATRQQLMLRAPLKVGSTGGTAAAIA